MFSMQLDNAEFMLTWTLYHVIRRQQALELAGSSISPFPYSKVEPQLMHADDLTAACYRHLREELANRRVQSNVS
jgi:hypothetical protein